MSFGSIFKPELWKMSITTFSNLSSGILFEIPDNSVLLRRSRLMIRSSISVFTFFKTGSSSLLIVSFVECSWDIVSFSFSIWLQRLNTLESMITFPFKAIIFCTNSGFLGGFFWLFWLGEQVSIITHSNLSNLTSPRREMRLRF